MISSFDLVKLHSLLKDFYNLTEMQLSIFDDNFHLLVGYPKAESPICTFVRQNSLECRLQCESCDTNACNMVSKRKSPITYHCHLGLTESIAPLYFGNLIIGYLFIGQIFPYPSHDAGWEQIQKNAKGYSLDMDGLKEAVYRQPITSAERLESAINILQIVAAHVCMERLISIKQQDLSVRIDDYISQHYTEQIDAAFLCKQFDIGKTQLYEIAKQNYGIGIAEQIRNLRIKKAQKLLEESELPMAEIAFLCGFMDYNYFITVFKRMVGVSPRKYAAQKNEEKTGRLE